MPLAILLLTRPTRVARLVALSGVAALLSSLMAVGGHPLAPVATLTALLATGAVLGVLAPLYGRTAAAGLWTARAGVALGGMAALFSGRDAATAARVLGAILVVAGLRLVARRAGALGDLPSWPRTAVGAGIVAVLLTPALGGGLVLAAAWFAVAGVIHAMSVTHARTAAARA